MRTISFAIVALVCLTCGRVAQSQESIPPVLVPSPYQVNESHGWVSTGRLGIVFPRYRWLMQRWISYDPERITVAELQRARQQIYSFHRW